MKLASINPLKYNIQKDLPVPNNSTITFGNRLNADVFTKSTTIKPSQSISFMSQANLQPAIDKIMATFNKPLLPQKHLENWLAQFEEADRGTALKLVNAVNIHTYPDMLMNVEQLHEKIKTELKKDGFDAETLKDVDYSKIFECKSGDVVSYMYRKANKIRSVKFKNFDQLTNKPPEDINNRALVILDDYTATGSQFLLELLAYHEDARELLSQYKKVYFAVVSANESAHNKFNLISLGQSDAIAEEICKQFKDSPEIKEERQAVFDGMKAINGDKLKLICLEKEAPLLAESNKDLTTEDKKEIKAFLEKYNVYKYPFGVGQLQGHTSFFYSAPNTLPDILWNSKISKTENPLTKKPWMPLLKRVEDISIYKMAKYVPEEAQVF